MNTLFLLMAQYNAALIPIDRVCADYFGGMKPETFLRKQLAGEIALPIVRMDDSQKCAKGIYLSDLATYLDRRHEAACKEYEQLRRAG